MTDLEPHDGTQTTRRMSRVDPRRILSLPSMYALHSWLVGPNKYKQDFVARFLKPCPGERVLDIGCGPGNLVPYMLDTDYVGFDGDKCYIEEANRKYGDRATFHHRWIDRKAVADLKAFDLILASGVLHHLNDDNAIALFQAAKDAMAPGGRLVTCDGVYTSDQGHLRRCIISMDRGEYIRTENEYRAIAEQVFPTVKSSLHSDLIRIPYTHCVMTCCLSE